MSPMGRYAVHALLAFLLGGCASFTDPPYPETPKVDAVDFYHGVRISDPYQWLEDLDSNRTRTWIDAQNELSSAWIDEARAREKIIQGLHRLNDHTVHGIPCMRGSRCFFLQMEGIHRRTTVRCSDALHGKPRVLLDSNALPMEGSPTLAGYSVSRDGRWLAFGCCSRERDGIVWHVLDVDTGRCLDDRLVTSSRVAWNGESRGFYYCRPAPPGAGGRLPRSDLVNGLYYHRLGTRQESDLLILSDRAGEGLDYAAQVSEDGAYLVVSAWKRLQRTNTILYKKRGDTRVFGLFNRFEARFRFIASDGPLFWFFTDLDAPLGRVIAMDVRKPSSMRTVIPQAPDPLRAVSMVHDTFMASYLRDAHSRIALHDRNGLFLRELEVPGISTVHGFSGQRRDTETFYRCEGFTDPGTVYRLDLRTGRSEVFRKAKVPFDPGRYVTRQAFCTSRDGTRVPLFITHARDLKLDGNNPVLLLGYGGFNTSITPYFAVS